MFVCVRTCVCMCICVCACVRVCVHTINCICIVCIHTGCGDKLPSYSVSVNEIRLPNCTYQFVVNISVGYDPVVLEQAELLTIHVTTDSPFYISYGDQSLFMPFNTVSV